MAVAARAPRRRRSFSSVETPTKLAEKWHAVPILSKDRVVNLRYTFTNGQQFAWRESATHHAGDHDAPPAEPSPKRGRRVATAGTKSEERTIVAPASGDGTERPEIFTGCLGHWVVSLRAELVAGATALSYCLHNPSAGDTAREREELERALMDYLHLGVSMDSLVSTWAAKDERMADIAKALAGMRILRQDPFECLISFICSSNNNIARIIGMLDRLRERFGVPLCTADDRQFYTFPTVGALASTEEDVLRDLGFGYRAKYIRKTAQLVEGKGGPEWLLGLRSLPHEKVQAELTQLAGVGPKVADCVALFSLDQVGCVPVDTHVWAIACRDFDPSLKETKSLTPKVYERVGNLFRDAYGSHAGWAHSLLFAAELPMFLSKLPARLQTQITEFRSHEKAARAAAKEAKVLRKKAKGNG